MQPYGVRKGSTDDDEEEEEEEEDDLSSVLGKEQVSSNVRDAMVNGRENRDGRLMLTLDDDNDVVDDKACVDDEEDDGGFCNVML